jgi:hypothetical protein
MPEKKRRLTVVIDDVLNCRLMAEELRSGAPHSEITRRALDAFLDDREARADAQAESDAKLEAARGR